MKNNDYKKRRGIADAIYCALGGAVMGLVVVMWAMSQSNIDQTINLQAAENSYMTAIHVSEEARLFMAKAMDFVLQLSVEDVSSHGGLTSKAPVTGMKTTAAGVRYWKWCAAPGLPSSCDNSDCGPTRVTDADLAGDAKKNMTAAAAGYLTDYTNAFEKNEPGHKVEMSMLNPDFALGDANVFYSSPMNTKVFTRPPGVNLDASFRTAGVVESADTIKASQNVRMKTALDMALAEAGGLPARNGAYTYDCGTPATKTFTRKCPMKVPKTCRIEKTCCSTDADGNDVCTDCSEVYDCSSCSDYTWQTMDSATVTDYDCTVTFKVPGSKMSYTLSPGEIKEKEHEFTFAASYRTWSGSCNTNSPPGTGDCGACKYE